MYIYIHIHRLPQRLRSKDSTHAEDTGSIPGSGRSPGGGYGNSVQYSCLENPMDRGTWWATVHRVTKNCTCLKCGVGEDS